MIDLFGNSGETYGSQGRFGRDPVTGALVPTVVAKRQGILDEARYNSGADIAVLDEGVAVPAE